ncbi:hypothetical protein [Chachezhania sediminis]|uniref:hypothetical protein n=1 Tax=Chachezhania sediminis TaxID=2599291 RepID=UPI0018EF0B21|nr:hypothetical protein [Chachezhania sediminis]
MSERELNRMEVLAQVDDGRLGEPLPRRVAEPAALIGISNASAMGFDIKGCCFVSIPWWRRCA